MNTAIAKIGPGRLALCAGGLGLLAVAAFGWGAPVTPSLRPQMADRPVVLEDGTQLFVQRFEVSIAEWNACHDAGGCTLALRALGNRSEAEMPATGLSYLDTREYIAWINAATRGGYRLPTLTEWEHMAAEVMPAEPDPIFTDPNLTWASTYLLEPQVARELRPQGAFDTTSLGIEDLNGNVWEWTQDCYAGDGIVALERCPAFMVGGEHIAAIPFPVRDPARGGCAVGAPPAHLGMRLVTTRRP